MKVLHCPTTTGGNPQGLARAERRVGLGSRSIAFCQNYLSYSCDEFLWNDDTPLWRQQIASLGLLLNAYRSFDVVHYNAGSTILPWSFSERWAVGGSAKWLFYSVYVLFCRYFESCLLRNKAIAVTFQGDDARQGDFSRANFDISIAHDSNSDYYSRDSDNRTRQRIGWFKKYADLIYALNPDLLWVLPENARFVPYANLDLSDWVPVQNPPNLRPVVVHAPSHRGAKGTAFILDAVARLEKEGVAFDFVLVENLSNAEARKVYEKADLVIDQLLAGWYGGIAVEAMALGKPVVCYLRETDFVFLPDEMKSEIPIANANPYTIYNVLRELLTSDSSELALRGAKSRMYVERWHDSLRIAEQLKSDYYRVVKNKKRCSLFGRRL